MLLSISSGDRFMLVAISFHNTNERGMHNVEDVKKINALSNARTLGRLIRNIQFSSQPEFSGIEPICVCQSAPIWR